MIFDDKTFLFSMNIFRLELILVIFSFNSDLFHNHSYLEYLLNNKKISSNVMQLYFKFSLPQ